MTKEIIKVEGLKVVNQKDLEVATELLSKANKKLDEIVAEKEKVTKPLNDALRAERARFKPFEVEADRVIGIIRGKMSEYRTSEVAKAGLIADKVKSGDVELSDGSKAIAVVNRSREVVGESGRVQFRERRVLEVVDIGKVDRKYLIVDEKMVLEVLKSGREVAGCRLKVEQVVYNYR